MATDDFTDAPVGLEQLTIDLPGHVVSGRGKDLLDLLDHLRQMSISI